MATKDRLPQLPAIMPGGIYTRQQIVNNLHISAHKVIAWEKAGLAYIPTGDGDKGKLYLSDDILAFFRAVKQPGKPSP